MSRGSLSGGPPSTVVKDYPVRGPLHQRRLAVSRHFACSRCGRVKVSRLLATYDEDWERLLCNACYGRLLSIYRVKRGDLPDEERAEALAAFVLETFSANDAARAARAMGLREDWDHVLSPKAIRFLGTATLVASALGDNPHLDWSAAIVGLTKALEVEAVSRLIPAPVPGLATADMKREAGAGMFAPIARYLVGTGTSPTLGQLARFMGDALDPIHRQRPPVSAYLKHLQKQPHPAWLLSRTGGANVLTVITRDFRNPATHTSDLNRASYDACLDMVAGPSGALWRVVDSTTGD